MTTINSQFPELERIPFVGREPLLQKIDEIVEQAAGRPTVVFLTGRGGIGKTELLKKVLARYDEADRQWFVASDVVDVYHPEVRTKTGLANRIVDTLPGLASPLFAAYQRARSEYGMQLLSESGRGIRTQVDAMRLMFELGLGNLCAENVVVVALDTAEKLVYPGEQPETGRETDELWTWLCELLSRMRNIVVLIAGRPQIEALQITATQYGALNVVRLELPPFDPDESEQYLTALQTRLEGLGKKVEAERLRSLKPVIRENVHRLTGGDPISFALLADLTAVGGQLSAELYDPSSPPPLAGAELDDSRRRLQDWFVERLLDQPALKDTLEALGYLPRGATTELLARVLGVFARSAPSIEQAQKHLSAILHLAIVKVSRDDQRVFLHDEIYAMLQRLHDHPGDASTNEVVRETIHKFYDSEIESVAAHFNEVSASVEIMPEPSDADFAQLTAANIQRRHLLIETLFYSLRQIPGPGFERYYRYMREAILTGDIVLDRELQTIMIEFLPECEDAAVRKLIREVMAPRTLVRYWAAGELDKAIEEAEKARGASSAAYSINSTVIDSWDAYARIYLGGSDNQARAKDMLDRAITFLRTALPQDAYAQNEPPPEIWRTLAVLAFALRVRGYWLRSDGRLRAAVPEYEEAVRIFRQINFKIELATSLNDLGFVIAELGFFADGRSLIRKAMALREELASRTGVAYCINTLAMIDVFEGKFEAAMTSAERARSIFRTLKIARGVGLCELTLAEARRRMSNPEDVPSPAQRLEGLEAALGHANRALAIFNEIGEQLRRAQAFVEIGCARRDMVLAYHALNVDQQACDEIARQSENALRAAVQIAESVSLRWCIDAWVNLAWLGNYATDDALLSEAEQAARDLIHLNRLDDYYVNQGSGKPKVDVDQAESWVWAQIGKLHAVRADHHFSQYQRGKQQGSDRDVDDKNLEKAITQYAIALENNQYGHNEDSRDLRRVKTQVDQRIESLTYRELPRVSQILMEFEKRFHLGDKGSFMRQLLRRRTLL